MERSYGLIETQMVVLARRIESAARRSTLFRRMDRAAYLIARTLLDVGPTGVNELARVLELDGSTVTRQIAVMESRGFVNRDPHPDDGRAWVITLTDDGLEEMSTIRTAREQRFVDYLHGWTDEDIVQLGVLLERFNHSLSTAQPPSLAPLPAHRKSSRSDHRRSVLPTGKRKGLASS